MTNKPTIRAQWGVAMELQSVKGYRIEWDGTTLRGVSGHELDHTREYWLNGEQTLLRPDGAQVLPPLGSKPEPKLDATEGNCSESPNSSPIVAEVGMEVVYRNSKGAIFNGTIRKITRSQSCLEVAMLEGGTLAFDWGGDGWLFHAYPAIITCAKTGRPVVLPNCQGLLNSRDESELSLSDSASDHIPDAGKLIAVGSQWRRNSDGEQCVVKHVHEDGDGRTWSPTVMFEDGHERRLCNHWLHRDHTYLFTPARDLSNLEDGWKIVGFDGTVVTHTIDANGDWSRLRDANGNKHSVNGLPSWVSSCGSAFWFDHGKASCLTGPASRCFTGIEHFHIDDEDLSPAEWADRRVADGATPDDVEEPWRHLIAEAMERAKPKSDRYSVELREGKKFDAWLVESTASGCAQDYVAKFRAAFQAEKVAQLLNEALEAKEAGDE